MNKLRKRGFTLIELIITIAILAIVLGVVFNFFLFNIKTYNKGEELTQVQFDARMAGDYITSRVRNVSQLSNLEIVDGQEISLGMIQSMYPNVVSISFTLLKEDNRNLLSYEIVGNSTNGSSPYSLESTVLLNNIRDMESVETAFNTLYYLE